MLIKGTVAFRRHEALYLSVHACVCLCVSVGLHVCVCVRVCFFSPPFLTFYWMMNCCSVLDLLQSFTKFEEIGRERRPRCGVVQIIKRQEICVLLFDLPVNFLIRDVKAFNQQ